jgi:hypothetical protein
VHKKLLSLEKSKERSHKIYIDIVNHERGNLKISTYFV